MGKKTTQLPILNKNTDDPTAAVMMLPQFNGEAESVYIPQIGGVITRR